ncbi:MAG: toprim domain-containing protein [Candidatus Babeliales bacterium]|jgi:hypothetical protein
MILLELAREAGIEPKWVASTQGGEYHSACPKCGGKDRFFIQPNRSMPKCTGYYHCRQCDSHGDTIQFGIDFLGYSFKAAVERLGIDLPHSYRPYALLRTEKTFKPLEVKALSDSWKEKALIFVNWAHQHLMQQPEILTNLERRGIPFNAVVRYKIGWCPMNFTRDAHEWGIDGGNGIWLPKGIVIPTFDVDHVVRLKIRRVDYRDGDDMPKYVAVAGSMNGLGIIGNKNNKTMMVVESELDAYALHHAVGDLACVVAVGSSMKNPDNVTDYYAQKAQHLLICHDNDDAGLKMRDKWKQLYPHSKGCPTPIGKDIGEAVAMGLNIRAWVLELLSDKSEKKPL